MTPALRLVRQLAQTPVAPIVPRIHLSTCSWCGGCGRYKAIVRGKWTQLPCTQCAGKGSIVGDAA